MQETWDRNNDVNRNPEFERQRREAEEQRVKKLDAPHPDGNRKTRRSKKKVGA